MIQFGSNDPVEYIYPEDPALDTAHPEFSWERYEKTRDRKHLPLREGAVPLVFKVRRLTRRQFFRAMGKAQHADQVQEAVAFGLVSIDPAPFSLVRVTDSLGEKLDEASMDHVYDAGALVMMALGSFIVGLSQAKTDPT